VILFEAHRHNGVIFFCKSAKQAGARLHARKVGEGRVPSDHASVAALYFIISAVKGPNGELPRYW
jgi:hypothetical protein